MADLNVKSEGVNVEQLMEQIRGRIREKRGVDYTEQELRELAAVKLEKFLDPRAVRSDLLEQFRKSKPPEFPVYALNEAMLFETHRPALRLIRRIFRPVLKLFFNPNRMVQAINEMVAKNQEARYNADHLSYEVLHNAVVELTRLGIELRNLKMRVESLAGRLELNERRERALVTGRWGLVPSWAKDPSIGSRMINARAETVAEKPAFRRAFAKRRCLIPADGYYEWYTPTDPTAPVGRSGKPVKQPFFIHPADGSSLAMAGLYEWWRDPSRDEGDPEAWRLTCTVITTDAADEIGRIHDRMPMTIARGD